jgi:methionine-rich copper-binding protein CopC
MVMRRLLVLVIIAVIAIPSPAYAHAQLAVSVPAHQSTVTEPLATVALSFTEAPSASASFTLTTPSGVQVQGSWSHGPPALLASPLKGQKLVDGVWQPLIWDTGYPAVVAVSHWPELGVYTAAYDFASLDGHRIAGTIRFDYQGPITTAAPPPPAPQTPSASFAWLWWMLGGVAAVLAVLLVVFLRRRRT